MAEYLNEQWVVEGVASFNRPSVEAMYIKPILARPGATGPSPRETLILDNNVLTDLLENRRPANGAFLAHLLKSRPIELNPIVAMLEQRQKFAGASAAVLQYRDYLRYTFGFELTDANVKMMDGTLEAMKPELVNSIEILSGYLSLTVHLYHCDLPALDKLQALIDVVVTKDLPFFQLHFYYAALVFAARENPARFEPVDMTKLREDMKVGKDVNQHWAKIRNLSNDLAFPALSIFSSGVESGSVYPYLVTRDRMSQLLLSEVCCSDVRNLAGGKATGLWLPHPGRLLSNYFGNSLETMLPKRSTPTTAADIADRSRNVREVADHYVRIAVAQKIATPKSGSSPV